MLECGIIYNNYSIKAGSYKESSIRGNKNYKYKVLPEYKKETTDYNRLSLAILNFTA